MHAQGVISLIPMDGYMFSHFQEIGTSSHITDTCEDKYCNSENPPFFLVPHSSACWAQCHMVWNILLVILDQLSRLCPFPDSCASSIFSLKVRSVKHKDLDSMWASLSNMLSPLFLPQIQNTTMYELLWGKLIHSHPKQVYNCIYTCREKQGELCRHVFFRFNLSCT